MFKGKLAIYMITLAAIAYLTGCTANSSPAAESAAEKGAIPESSAISAGTSVKSSGIPGDPYEIIWYVLGNGPQKDVDIVDNEIGKYLKDKINVDVRQICLEWGTYEAKMQTIIASSQPYDICFTASWWNRYVENSRKGAFVALNGLMDRYAPKTKALLGQEFLKGSQVDGINYGIPCNKEKARNYGFVYNKELAEKYGFDMSKVHSYSDIEPMLKVIKKYEPDYVPLIEGKSVALIPFNAANITDVGLMKEDGRYYNQYATQEFKDAYEMARKYYLAGYFKKDVVVQRDADAVKNVTGKFFAYIVNIKPGYADEKNIVNKQNGFEVGQVDITAPVTTNSETMGSIQAISTTSGSPENALMLLEYVNTDKYVNNLLNYGIENVHYTKISDNVIKLKDNSGYAPNMQWMYGNQMLNYLLPNEDPKKWENYDAYNKAAKPAPDLGFVFNATPVSTQMAACANIIREYGDNLAYGTIDPEVYLPEFLDKLKSAGADLIVAEKQRQFDVWKAQQKK